MGFLLHIQMVNNNKKNCDENKHISRCQSPYCLVLFLLALFFGFRASKFKLFIYLYVSNTTENIH